MIYFIAAVIIALVATALYFEHKNATKFPTITVVKPVKKLDNVSTAGFMQGSTAGTTPSTKIPVQAFEDKPVKKAAKKKAAKKTIKKKVIKDTVVSGFSDGPVVIDAPVEVTA